VGAHLQVLDDQFDHQFDHQFDVNLIINLNINWTMNLTIGLQAPQLEHNADALGDGGGRPLSGQRRQ